MTRSSILLAAALLLLSCRSSLAQISAANSSAPAAHVLMAWSRLHIPAKFQTRGKVEVQPLSDAAMDNYLHDDPDSDTDAGNESNSEDSDSEVDGVFTDDPPQIFLRVSDPAQIDYATFAHEYGHYVWFDLLTDADRKRYKAIYEHQKAAHRLISDYAGESLEEGFAEAFSADIISPVELLHQDPLSYQFLSRWPKEQ